MRARFHGYVRGYVQGVAYRWFAQRQAAALSLSGWVRNLPDGGVEVVAEGERAALEDFAAVLRRGPRMAVVEALDLSWEDPAGETGGFRIDV